MFTILNKQNNADHINVSPGTLFSPNQTCRDFIYSIVRNEEHKLSKVLFHVSYLPFWGTLFDMRFIGTGAWTWTRA